MNHPAADPRPWLLEADPVNPGVRLFALRDLLHRPAGDPDVIAAQAAVMRTGPVAAILDAQYPAGYWVKPGPGYSPKYRATLWQVIFLPQLGADGRDERVRRAVEYVFDHAQASDEAFSFNGRPKGGVFCLWGNVVKALLDLGWAGDPRLARSIDVLAGAVTGAGFGCAYNEGLPCAWGAIRTLWAFNRIPAALRTPAVDAAAATCAEFLLGYDVARANYPTATRISLNWFKFGYPLAYITDLLLNVEVLVEAGYGSDPRLDAARAVVRSGQDAQGRWKLDYTYNGKMWADVEQKGKPSKWVTLRALRALELR
ncbi:MAG: nitrogen fixation protein NifH [Anaerolineae bacterium]|nr:nitrogen fixation protein NifH [Anaerolineae bacterium]